jgi:hypothetical protein
MQPQYDMNMMQQMMQQQQAAAMFAQMQGGGQMGMMPGMMPGQGGQMQGGQMQGGQMQGGQQQMGGDGQDRKRGRPQNNNNNNNNNAGGGGGGNNAGGQGERAPQVRNNEIGDPARVIHLRNVTPEVSQLSIQNLVQSFGRVKSIVMLRQKNQALVEMETIQSAQQMVDFFKDPGYAEIDGRRVYLRYSHHGELTASVHTSKTLLVSMFNTQYDVSAAAQITPMIVYQIFGSYGQVEKIVVLPKNDSSAQNHNRVQALVQFDTKETAESVKNMLQGQPVTLGETITFTLDIQFSRMEEIKTSSPHNSLVVPKGSTPQTLMQNPAAAQNSQVQQQAAMQQFMMQQQAQQQLQGGGGGGNGQQAMMPAGGQQLGGSQQGDDQQQQQQQQGDDKVWN